MGKRYRLAVCRECLGFGIRLTTDEYMEILGCIVESSAAKQASSDDKTWTPIRKPVVLQRADGEIRRCQRCEGTGWMFTDTPGTHVLPDMTWERR